MQYEREITVKLDYEINGYSNVPIQTPNGLEVAILTKRHVPKAHRSA